MGRSTPTTAFDGAIWYFAYTMETHWTYARRSLVQKFFCWQNDSCENLDNFSLIRLLYIVHGHVYSHGIFFKKANHYNNFNCYTLGNAKPVVGTSKNLAEPDYDVIKVVAILNFNTNLLCFIISIIVGRFKFFRHQNVQNDKCCLLTSKNGWA